MNIRASRSWAVTSRLVTSWAATLLTFPAVSYADSLDLTWTIAPGDQTYLTTGNTERGVAINPSSKRVLLVSRAGGPQVYVLSSEDGSDGSAELGAPRVLNQFDLDGNFAVTGGFFTLNLVGAGADGAVYACALSLDVTATPFKVYRWEDDDIVTPVAVAFEGDPTSGQGGAGQDLRFGDNFAVRGTGADTQLAAMSRNGKYLTIFTTTDGLSFTATTLTTDASGKGGLGLTFGEGNTVWSKINGQSLVQLEFDLEAGTATTVRSVPTTVVGTGVTGIGYDSGSQRLAVVDYAAHTFAVFDFSDPNAPTRVGDPLAFPAANANGNGTAAASVVGEQVVGLDTNNGLLAVRVNVSTVVEPPVIVTAPMDQTVLEGGSVQFGVVAQGTKPLSYQWSLDGVSLPGETNAVLVLPNVQPVQAGDYGVAVQNSAGEAMATTRLTVVALVKSDALTLRWQLAPGDRPWLNSDNSQRGLAYNPANGHVLVISRTEGNQIYVLDGQTGEELHTLNVDPAVVFGGTFALNMLGVAEDGAVFAGNLTTDGTTSAFNLYRWADDAPGTIPELVYAGDPGVGTPRRWGDSLDVRGSGLGTQILAGSRNGQDVAIFTTVEGAFFNPTLVTVEDATAGDFGLSVAFGPGDTFFGKANATALRRVAFDLGSGIGTTVDGYGGGFPASVATIAWDDVREFLAGIALENPDNVRLYDLADIANPVLIDQEFCAADNPNLNGTGQAGFGGDMLFALNSNNGIVAFAVKEPSLSTPPELEAPQLASENGQPILRFNLVGQSGARYDIQRSADFQSWRVVATVTAGAEATPVTVPALEPLGFYRAIGQ